MKPRYIYFILCMILAFIASSCNKPKEISTCYSQLSLSVPSISQARLLTMDSIRYSIVDAISLSMPEGIGDIAKTPVFCRNHIYILDANYENVLVFDNKGNFLHKIGGKGHARNEIIGTIRTFDVDRHTGYVHVYNRDGRKILVFDNEGTFVKAVLLDQCLPSYICVNSEGNGYIASCNSMSTKEGNTKLVVMDEDGNITSTILETLETNNITSEGIDTKPLYSDYKGNITYLPMLSDSLIVLSGDTVSNVVKMSFDDGFVSQSVMEQSKSEGHTPEEGNIHFITKSLINDYLVFVEFIGKPDDEQFASNYTYVYNRGTGETYYQRGYMGFEKMLGSVRSINEDCFVVLLTEDNIIELEKFLKQMPSSQRETNIEDFASGLYGKLSVDAITRKIKVPLLVKVKVKW